MKSYEFSYMICAVYGLTNGVTNLLDGINLLDIISFIMSSVVFAMFITINWGKYYKTIKQCLKRFKK